MDGQELRGMIQESKRRVAGAAALHGALKDFAWGELECQGCGKVGDFVCEAHGGGEFGMICQGCGTVNKLTEKDIERAKARSRNREGMALVREYAELLEARRNGGTKPKKRVSLADGVLAKMNGAPVPLDDVALPRVPSDAEREAYAKGMMAKLDALIEGHSGLSLLGSTATTGAAVEKFVVVGATIITPSAILPLRRET